MGPKVELGGEDVIQAVVVADSFSSAFAPLTLSTPACPLPPSGRPLFEYTLEVLASSPLFSELRAVFRIRPGP